MEIENPAGIWGGGRSIIAKHNVARNNAYDHYFDTSPDRLGTMDLCSTCKQRTTFPASSTLDTVDVEVNNRGNRFDFGAKFLFNSIEVKSIVEGDKIHSKSKVAKATRAPNTV